MSKEIFTTIIGSGSCIPDVLIKNDYFLDHEFYDPKDNSKLDKANAEVIDKFAKITNIQERRWARKDQVASDLGAIAAKNAIDSSGVDMSTLDFIIVGHNFGDIYSDNNHIQQLPNLAARVKNILGVNKPSIVAFDVMAGCPGWVQAMIVADALIKSGNYKRGMVVGADVNSRAGDPYDRDYMIFADGAGAVIVEGVESDTPVGILSHSARTDVGAWSSVLEMRSSLNLDFDQSQKFIGMQGHKVYVYALQNVPGVAKEALDKANLELSDINKVLIHQANEKMDVAICQRLMKLYNMKGSTTDILPMTINELGNSSAATVPTLYDLIKKGKMKGHEIKSGDHLIFTSVGAGMQINAIVYKEI